MKKQDLNGVRTPSDLERKYSFSLLKKAIELVENGLTKIQGELYNFVDATTKHFKSVDGKLDGYYSIWFFAGVPSLENAPASEWDDFSIHLDDLYYDTDTGYSYRFILENNEYKWIKLDDDDLSNVLAIASHAQDTADSKRRVFVEEPVPPYDVGDLWITKGQIFACEQSRTVDDAAANPANDFGLTLDYASNGRVDGVQDVTDSIETLFTIDRKNGKIVLNAEKLLQIGSKGKLLIDGGILVVNASNYQLNEDGTVTITGGSIGGFNIDLSSIHSKKTAIDDPTEGVYIGTTGIGVGDGNTHGISGSPFEVYADGTVKMRGKNGSIMFDPISGDIDIVATNFCIGTSAVVVSTQVTYQTGTSGTVAPTGGWQESIPTVNDGEYLWTKTLTNYSNGNEQIDYSVSKQNGEAIMMTVTSSNGNVIRSSDDSIVLTAHVFVNGAEQDIDDNGVCRYGTVKWYLDSELKGSSRTLTVLGSRVNSPAVYTVQLE